MFFLGTSFLKVSSKEEQRRKLFESPTLFRLPFTASPFQASFHEEKSKTRGTCPRNGFNAQPTNDLICKSVDECNLGWTEPGEYIAFDFETNEEDFVFDNYNNEYELRVDVTIRVASLDWSRMILLEIGNDVDGSWPNTYLNSPGLGWQEFTDMVWHNVQLNMDVSNHSLYVFFLHGKVNLCSVSVRKSRYVDFEKGLNIPALDFDDFYEKDPGVVLGTCGDGLVDAQPTNDLICQYRDSSCCNIGWTEAGEWVSYDFTTPDSEDYDVWIRVASGVPGQKVRAELQFRGDWYHEPFVNGSYSRVFDVPALGWQNFVDVRFSIYLTDADFRIIVHFETGNVNLCSLGVDFMKHWSVEEYEPPLKLNAYEHYDMAIDHSPNHFGNCDIYPEKDVDSKLANDEECASTGACYVAFTQPGEMLRYDFAQSNANLRPRMIDIRLRVASLKKKVILVEVDGNRLSGESPGEGWDIFQDIEWNNVALMNSWYHQLYVVFVEGNVNLCLVEIKFSDE